MMTSETLIKDKTLAHLTETEIEEFYDLYINSRQPVLELMKKYKVNVSQKELFYYFPKISIDSKCPNCMSFMEQTRPSRTMAIRKCNDNDITCNKCDHQIYKNENMSEACNCEYCSALKQNKLKKLNAVKVLNKKRNTWSSVRTQQATMNAVYDLIQNTGVKLSTLTTNEKLTLLVITELQPRYSNEVAPFGDREYFDNLIPYLDVENVVEELIKKMVLTPSKMSLPGLLEPECSERIATLVNSDVFNKAPGQLLSEFLSNQTLKYNASWEIAVLNEMNERYTFSELNMILMAELKDLNNENDDGNELLLAVRTELAYAELSNICNNIQQDNFGIIRTTDMAKLYTQLIKLHSVSDISYFIELAYKSAHEFYVTGLATSFKHAENTFIFKVQQYALRSAKEEWKTKALKRISGRSVLSKIIYERVLEQYEDQGYFYPIT